MGREVSVQAAKGHNGLQEASNRVEESRALPLASKQQEPREEPPGICRTPIPTTINRTLGGSFVTSAPSGRFLGARLEFLIRKQVSFCLETPCSSMELSQPSPSCGRSQLTVGHSHPVSVSTWPEQKQDTNLLFYKKEEKKEPFSIQMCLSRSRMCPLQRCHPRQP